MNLKRILEDFIAISIRILLFFGICFLIIILIIVAMQGVSFFLPAFKNIFKNLCTKIPTTQDSKTVFEAVLNNANFTIVFISLLFALIGIIVGILTFRWNLILNQLDICRQNFEKMEKFIRETSKSFTLESLLTNAKIYYTNRDYSPAWEQIKDIPDTFSYEVSLYKARILFHLNKDKPSKEKDIKLIMELLNTALEFPNITKASKATVYNFIGRVWEDLKEYKQALLYCEKAIEQKYTYWSAHNLKAIAFRHLDENKLEEKLNNAIETLKNIIRIDDTYSYAHYNLACYYCLLLKKDISFKKQVIEYLDKAIKLRSQFKKTAQDDLDFNNIRGDIDFENLIRLN